MHAAPPITVGFISLGCAKNLVDSEMIATGLIADGFRLAPAPQQADVVIVNTCAFIRDAKAESIDAVIEAEGARVPAPDSSLHVVDVAVLVLESDNTGLDQAMCEALTATSRERLDEFQLATLGRLVLHNLVSSSATCEELARELPPRRAVKSRGCDLVAHAPRKNSMLVLVLLLVVMLGRRARLRTSRRATLNLSPARNNLRDARRWDWRKR